MSVKAITWAFGLDVKPAAKKLVLVCLADIADDNGILYPSLVKLAAKTNVNKNTVSDHLRGLEKDGLLSRFERRKAGKGHKLSNAYLLALPDADDVEITDVLQGHFSEKVTRKASRK